MNRSRVLTSNAELLWHPSIGGCLHFNPRLVRWLRTVPGIGAKNVPLFAAVHVQVWPGAHW